MRLYLCTNTDYCDYDQYDAMVVRAETAKEAVLLAVNRAGPEFVLAADGQHVRYVPHVWTAEPLDHDGDPAVVLGSFHAG